MAPRAMDCEYVFKAQRAHRDEAGIARSVVERWREASVRAFDKHDESDPEY